MMPRSPHGHETMMNPNGDTHFMFHFPSPVILSCFLPFRWPFLICTFAHSKRSDVTLAEDARTFKNDLHMHAHSYNE